MVKYLNESEQILNEMHFSKADLQDPKTIDRIQHHKEVFDDVRKYLLWLFAAIDVAAGIIIGGKLNTTTNGKGGKFITTSILLVLLNCIRKATSQVSQKQYDKDIKKYKSKVLDLMRKMEEKKKSDPDNASKYQQVIDNCQSVLDEFDRREKEMRDLKFNAAVGEMEDLYYEFVDWWNHPDTFGHTGSGTMYTSVLIGKLYGLSESQIIEHAIERIEHLKSDRFEDFLDSRDVDLARKEFDDSDFVLLSSDDEYSRFIVVNSKKLYSTNGTRYYADKKDYKQIGLFTDISDNYYTDIFNNKEMIIELDKRVGIYKFSACPEAVKKKEFLDGKVKTSSSSNESFNDSISSVEPLNEVYFGRDVVAPLQKQITSFRNKLAGKTVTTTTNLDPELLKFNRLAESIFGFSSFAIYIQPDYSPNAYAFPVDIYFSEEERRKILNSLVVSGGHFKYDKALANVSMIIAIHQGLLDNREFTDEEIMATILHEIGHGFFEAVTDNECVFTSTRKLNTILATINKMVIDKVKAGKQVTENIINKELSNLNGLIGEVKSKLAKFKSKIFKESMEDNMKKNRLAYTNEKFADTFAAMFGYGEECHSVDIKIMNYVTKEVWGVKTYPKIIETIKAYKMYLNGMLAYALNLQDEHPAELARIKTTVDYLKKELSKEGLDPKIKRELLAELEKANALIQEYINYPKDEDSMRILRLYYIKLYEKFGGDQRERDTDNDALFSAIDARYNRLADK